MSTTLLRAEYEGRVRRMVEQPNISDSLLQELNKWMLLRSQSAKLVFTAPADVDRTTFIRQVDYCDYHIKLLLNL